jgi:hypothetical protein
LQAKQQGGDLISRDYLERDKDNPQLFKYLAKTLRLQGWVGFSAAG